MNLGVSVYRVLLRLYPSGFRQRFGEEMLQVFEEDQSRNGGLFLWFKILADVAESAPREHLAEFRFRNAAPLLAGLVIAAPIGYIDLYSTEVQGIVFLILVLAGLFGLIWPKRAWLWFLMFGVSVPAWHFGRAAMGLPPTYPVHPNIYATCVAFIPAAIGALCGAGCRLAMQEVSA